MASFDLYVALSKICIQHIVARYCAIKQTYNHQVTPNTETAVHSYLTVCTTSKQAVWHDISHKTHQTFSCVTEFVSVYGAVSKQTEENVLSK